ncbi:RDD family protein [uncultured Jannaschia sp.]|uniref:RDD family protein n=1 Tax=Jannaschia halovivens TaxID=3388667 RepID=UPI00261F7EA2|nr:RDD family protein [uncultured Jannaschia sp.]
MTYLTATTALPDPVDQPEFYNGVLAKRALAWIVDVALITGFTIVAGILTLTLAFFLWPVAFIAIGALYRIGTLASGSATWGMRLMGIELRGPSGDRFDGMQSMLHVLGYYASMSFVLPALASIAAMFVTGRRQGLTDLVLGSAAINRPS